MLDMDEIRGAVARGWCHTKNSHKVMDSDLALAISDEVMSLLAANKASISESATLCTKCGKPYQMAVNGVCITCDPTGDGCIGTAGPVDRKDV